MGRIAKRKYVFAVSAVLVVVPVVLILLIKNKNVSPADRENRETAEEVFMYDSVLPDCQYSEHMVLYLDGSSLLHMIDTATGKDMVYCDRPNCTHELFSAESNPNPSCPAVFYGIYQSAPVLHNRHLYYIGNMTQEDEFKTQYLYVMDANGENRKKAVALENVQRIPYVLYRDDYAVGVFRNNCELNEDGQIINDNWQETGVFVIDLKNYKVQMGDRITDGRMISDLYYADGAAYYLCSYLDVDMSVLMDFEPEGYDYTPFFIEHMHYEYCRYDIASGKTELVKKLDRLSEAQLEDGDIYFKNSEGCFVFDRKSGETVKLSVPEGAGGFHKGRNAVYFSVCDRSNDKATYYRMKDGTVNELMSLPNARSFAIANICGESVYIGYYDENGEFMDGVLSLEDLDRGEFNVRKLR